eukprot:858373-Pleurochrysis_carterae.AAC.5
MQPNYKLPVEEHSCACSFDFTILSPFCGGGYVLQRVSCRAYLRIRDSAELKYHTSMRPCRFCFWHRR